jgi:hypothetical protein
MSESGPSEGKPPDGQASERPPPQASENDNQPLDATEVVYRKGIRLVAAANITSKQTRLDVFNALKSVLAEDQMSQIEAICKHAALYTWVVIFKVDKLAEQIVGKEITIKETKYRIDDASKRYESTNFTRVVSEGKKYSSEKKSSKPYCQVYTISGLPAVCPRAELVQNLTSMGFNIKSNDQLSHVVCKDKEMRHIKQELVEVKQFISYEKKKEVANRLAGQKQAVLGGYKFQICITCPGVCYRCFEYGHMSTNCPKRLESVKCFFCGKNGHEKKRCPKYQAWQTKRRDEQALRVPFVGDEAEEV